MTKTLTRSMTYAELVAEITAGTLNKGEKITVTDFRTAHYMNNGTGNIIRDALSNPVVNEGPLEPLTVTALNNNTLDKTATSELYPYDIIHYDWNGNNWINDISFAAFDQQVLPQWKGVIYFRHDTLNDVSMGHDFRNVLNRRWKRNDPVWTAEATFAKGDLAQDANGLYISYTDANTGNPLSNADHWQQVIHYNYTPYVCAIITEAQDETDYIDVPCFYSQNADPVAQYRSDIKSVHFKPMKDDMAGLEIYSILQNNVFVLATNFTGNQVTGITAEMYCLNNTFMEYMFSNVLGAHFKNNITGKYFENNVINQNCYNNIIGRYFNRNFIQSQFNTNILCRNFSNNTIGYSFQNNKILHYFSSNLIENYFSDNILQEYFNYNNIGSYFRKNKTGPYFMMNTIQEGFDSFYIGGYDFSPATHVYNQYNCTIFRTPNDSRKLSYVDDAGVQQIVDAFS